MSVFSLNIKKNICLLKVVVDIVMRACKMVILCVTQLLVTGKNLNK